MKPSATLTDAAEGGVASATPNQIAERHRDLAPFYFSWLGAF